MAPASRPHARVYLDVPDDTKFDTVFPDDHHFATWVRLLMYAEQAYPEYPPIPASTRRASLKVLVAVGLVDLRPGGRYAIHGLKAEREARSQKARDAAEARWGSDRNANVGNADALHSQSDAMLAPHSPTSTSSPRENGGAGGEGESPRSLHALTVQNVMAAVLWLEQRTGRAFGFGAGSKVWDTLEADVRDFGWPAVMKAMEAVTVKHPDIGQLVFGASRALHPITSPEKPDPALERAAAEQAAFDRKVAATQRELARMRGEA